MNFPLNDTKVGKYVILSKALFNASDYVEVISQACKSRSLGVRGVQCIALLKPPLFIAPSDYSLDIRGGSDILGKTDSSARL
jgi:hypothetical protein